MISESGCFFRSFSWEKNFRSRNLRIIVSNSFTTLVEVFLFGTKGSCLAVFVKFHTKGWLVFSMITEVLVAVKWTKIILAKQSRKQIDFEIKKISEIVGYSFMVGPNCGTISNRCTHNL